MFFGGLQKNSFIDYPGRVSCVLFLSGCNFDCPYCHNPELAIGCRDASSPFIKESAVFDFLKQRKSFLDGVVISGGEPTLQKDLIQLCQKIKDMGYPVKLDTNGSRPKVIEELIRKGLADYIAMDIKTDPKRYSPLIQKDCSPDDIVASIRIIMDSGLPYEFRTTCVKPLVNEQVITAIGQIIFGARLYVLQQFHASHHVLHPEYFQNKDHLCTPDELLYLKSVAERWVQECIIR